MSIEKKSLIQSRVTTRKALIATNTSPVEAKSVTKPNLAKPGLAKPGLAKPGLAKPGLA